MIKSSSIETKFIVECSVQKIDRICSQKSIFKNTAIITAYKTDVIGKRCFPHWEKLFWIICEWQEAHFMTPFGFKVVHLAGTRNKRVIYYLSIRCKIIYLVSYIARPVRDNNIW